MTLLRRLSSAGLAIALVLVMLCTLVLFAAVCTCGALVPTACRKG